MFFLICCLFSILIGTPPIVGWSDYDLWYALIPIGIWCLVKLGIDPFDLMSDDND